MHPRLTCAAALLTLCATQAMARDLWTPEAATAWYAEQPWMVGSNYLPRSAINELEMWQAETFDPDTIDQEFGWAEHLGMTTMRVFLHNLVWQQDASGFTARIERVLALAGKHHLRLMLVLFDSCWDPEPTLGPQHAPTPHVHNSGWVQAPGAAVLKDPDRREQLKGYVVGIVSHFRADRRVVLWDVYNELDNRYGPKPYQPHEPADKAELALQLAARAKEWALSADPSQPISFCIWENWTSAHDALSPAQRFQVDNSDVITFHAYANRATTAGAIQALRTYRRPLLCSEYMARPTGSTFQAILPLFKQEKIAAYNWGFVDGKSQTKFAWDSWDKAYGDEPATWFHEVLRHDGTPYDPAETDLIRRLTGAAASAPASP
jgi:hypothetical protein